MEKESILVDSSEAFFCLILLRFIAHVSQLDSNSIHWGYRYSTTLSTQFTPAMSQFQFNSDSLTKQLDSTLLDSFLRNRVGIDSWNWIKLYRSGFCQAIVSQRVYINLLFEVQKYPSIDKDQYWQSYHPHTSCYYPKFVSRMQDIAYFPLKWFIGKC